MQILVGSLGIGDSNRFADRIRRELDRTSDPASKASIWLFIAVHHLYRAHWDDCIAAARTACQIADEIGFRRTWEEASVCIASTHMNRGQPDKGIPICEDIVESARRGAHRVQLWALTMMAVMAVRRGDSARARAAVQRAAALPTDKLEVVDGVFQNAAAALVHVFDRDFEAARVEADRAAEIISRTPSFIVEHYGAVVWLMEVYVALWRERAAGSQVPADLARTARRICQTALGVARRMPYVGPEAEYWLGECEWLSGQPRRARARWTRSEKRAATLQMPYQRDRAQAALSRTPTF
jgi:ATP/maltotriose-dependent transcriptional regulator MalT